MIGSITALIFIKARQGMLLGLVSGIFVCFLFSLQVYAETSKDLSLIKVKAAVLNELPPLYVKNSSGKPTGFAIDVLNIIAKQAHLEVSYVPVKDFAKAMEAVRSGKADFVPGMGITKARQREFSYSHPIETVPISCFIRSDCDEIKGLSDLIARPIAIIPQTAPHTFFLKKQGMVLVFFQNVETALLQLLAGNVDALVFSEPMVWKKVNESGLSDRIKVAGKPLFELKRAYLFLKGNTVLRARVNPVIEEFTKTEDYLKIYLKWNGKPEPFWNMRKVTLLMGFFCVLLLFFAIIWRSSSLSRINRNLSEEVLRRKRAQADLAKSIEAFRTVADYTYDWEMWRSEEGVLLYVSPSCERITGYKPDDFIDDPGLEIRIIHIEDQAFMQDHFIRCQSPDTKVEEVEFRIITKKGENRWVAHICHPVLDKHGKWSGRRISNRDITEQKRAKEEKTLLETHLSQSSKMEAMGTLAGGIAHDFNNILSAIIGYSELLQSEFLPGDEKRSNVDQILKAGMRAKDLVKQILIFSRRSEQELKPVQLHLIVEEVLKLIRATIPSNITIEKSLESKSYLMADPSQIHQVLMNFCANAGYAMQEQGGVLRVDLRDVEIDNAVSAKYLDIDSGSYINLVVSDTGIGMEPEVVERVFDPFFTTKGQGEGTGMGLSVAHGIIKSLNGAIHVYSEPGIGSTFSAYFPRLQNKTAHQAVVKHLSDLKGNESILVVDDEKPIAFLAGKMLGKLGYQVEVVTDSRKALALYEKKPERFDLVLTDVTMPGLTGDVLARKMMEIRPDMPIVLATGFSARITEKSVEELGVRSLISKPYVMIQLAETVRHVLDRP